MSQSFSFDPKNLVAARLICHKASQWPSMAARANLPALADDSHSNLGWNPAHSALMSHSLSRDGNIQLGYSFATRALIWVVDARIEQTLYLDTCSVTEVGKWVDSRLAAAKLQPLSRADMPYALAGKEDYSELAELKQQCAELGAWFDYAQKLLDALADKQNFAVGEVTVRCWPHHFDLGLLLALESGDPENAPSIGMGFSPGDDSYSEPYFYCSPWPVPEVSDLPAPVRPLAWHTEGFVSLVVRGADLSDIAVGDLLWQALNCALAATSKK